MPMKQLATSELPSLRSGMSLEEELIKRRKTCRFIEQACRILKLSKIPLATAFVLFHRFYVKHSFQDHDRFEVAVACIVLAAKTEETPKKLNLVIEECHKLKIEGMKAGRVSTQPSSSTSPASVMPLDPKGEEFAKIKERILLLERVILHTIGFELSIDHPYKFIMVQIKGYVANREIEFIEKPENSSAATPDPSSTLMARMVQFTLNFINDSFHTLLCLQCEPRDIATACIYMAAHFAKVRPVNKQWLELLGNPDIEVLSFICLEILQLISQYRNADQTTLNKIKQNLTTLKSARSNATAASASQKPPPPPPSGQPDAKRQRTG